MDRESWYSSFSRGMSAVEKPNQSVAQYNVRPRRIAYLVLSRNRGQLLKAMRYASSEWGGINQVIVPITPKRGIDPGWLQVCDTVEPEVFIDYAPALELKDMLQSRYGATIYDEQLLTHEEPGVHVLVAIPPGACKH